MTIHEHYEEVLDVIDKLFLYIFEGLNSRFGEGSGLHTNHVFPRAFTPDSVRV